ncbi:hypothetical protein C1645_818243 [Glomus cerebriforme]|uniref:Uncharacterized protein n=1 Tax=Glomus cerebriforme TaxID=658196 RepID=A0A397T7Q7_9GLOM|nr:hypothetical protein C1645_818243 [Glomus cerebriforme]
MISADEEESNKRKNIEDTSSSISDTSEKNNDDNVKFLEYLEFLCFRIKFLEKNIEYDNFMNNSFIKHLIKEVAKISFNISIYPNKDELRIATEEYFKLHYQEFYHETNKLQ